MISNSNPTKKLNKYQEQRLNREKQREEAVQNALNTLKQNPKFLRLVVYSLNTLESLVSHPNREIRDNARLISRLDGSDILKIVTISNFNNDSVVFQSGNIQWKMISINDSIEQELCKIFVDNNGHDIVIEVLMTVPKEGWSAKPYIKILNGLSQVPQLIQKLLNSGMVETVKLVNDIYQDDMEIITMNFDSMKKISNLKTGREFLLQKDLIPNLMKNIKKSATQHNSKAVINGFTVVDNLSKSESGKEALKENNVVENVSQILDYFENDDKVLKMGAKIYSKISKPEDMEKEIQNLIEINNKNDYSNLKDLEKSLILVSNFMLVDDICKRVCSEENINLLKDIFNGLINTDVTGKTMDYLKGHVLLNKYFMVVFNRIENYAPEVLQENKDLIKNINESVAKNYENTRAFSVEEKEEFAPVFKEYFSSFTEIFEKNMQTDVDIPTVKNLLNIVREDMKLFELDEKANYAVSRILKVANKAEDPEIQQQLGGLIKYCKDVVSTSEDPKTIENNLEVILDVCKEQGVSREEILPSVVNFMSNKPKYRQANLINLQLLDLAMTNSFVDNYLKSNKDKNLNLVQAIASVMSGHEFETSNVLKVVSGSDKTENVVHQEQSNENLEKKISKIGASLLEKLVDANEFRKIIKGFKDLANGFNSATASGEVAVNLESNLQLLSSVLKIKNYFSSGYNDVLEGWKTLVKKEIAFVENFKKEKGGNKLEKGDEKTSPENEKYKEVIDASSKRLNMAVSLLKEISSNCITNFMDTGSLSYIGPIKDMIQNELDIMEKSTDPSILNEVVSHLSSNLEFIMENESALSGQEEAKGSNGILSVFQEKKYDNVKFESSFGEKASKVLMNVLRKTQDNDELTNNVVNTFVSLCNKKPEITNALVKSGCPRVLLQIVETTSEKEVVKNALELTKIIALSNEENLAMVSNQQILEKLHEVHTKFSNDEEITRVCNLITNEAIKLPENEHAINEIITSSINEITDIVKIKSDEQAPVNTQGLLTNLEKLNAFCSNKQQLSLINDDSFIINLDVLFNMALNDPEVAQSQLNEKILSTELSLLKKIDQENKHTKDQKKTEMILKNVLTLMNEKSNYRDIYLNTAKILSQHLADEGTYITHLKDTIDEKFIDTLIDTAENYVDDREVTKQINNVLCNLCVRSESLANHIVQNGGLNTVMEELRSLSSNHDEESQNMKMNSLQLIHSLVKDDKNMEKFLQSRGGDLVLSLIHSEVKFSEGEKEDKELEVSSLYCVQSESKHIPLKLNKKKIKHSKTIKHTKTHNDQTIKRSMTIKTKSRTDAIMNSKVDSRIKITTEKNSHLAYSLKIIDQNLKKGLDTFNDTKLISNLVKIAQKNYPNKYIYTKVLKIIKRNRAVLENLNETDKKHLANVIVSNMAEFGTDEKVIEASKNILPSLEYEDKELAKFLSEPNIDPEVLNKMFTFASVSAINNVNKFSSRKELQEPFIRLYHHMINTYGNTSVPNKNLDESVVLSLLKSTKYLLRNNLVTREDVKDMKVEDTLLQLGLNFYTPSNVEYVEEYLKEFKELYEDLGEKVTYDGKIVVVRKDSATRRDLTTRGNSLIEYVTDVSSIPHKQNEGEEPSHSTGDVTNKEEDESTIQSNKRNSLANRINFKNGNEGYGYFLQNVYLRSFEFFDNYHNQLKSVNLLGGEIDTKVKQNFINTLKDIQTYFKLDIDMDIKVSSMKQLSATCLSLSSENSDENSHMTPIWDVIRSAITKDVNNVICGNEEVVGTMVSDLTKLILNNPNNTNLRETLTLISTKLENNSEIFEKIIHFAEEDIHRNGEESVSSVEMLSNLSKFPIVPKIILKNHNLFDKLKKIQMNKKTARATRKQRTHKDLEGNSDEVTVQENVQPDPGHKEDGDILIESTSNIFKHILRNEYNNEEIVAQHPEIIASLVEQLSNEKLDDKTEVERAALKNDMEAFISLISDPVNFKALSSKGLITMTDVSKVVSNFSQDPELSSGLVAVQDNINNYDKEKRKEEEFKSNLEATKSLTENVNDLLRQHFGDLQSLKEDPMMTQSMSRNSLKSVRNSTKMSMKLLTTQGNVLSKMTAIDKNRASLITRTLFFNSDNIKIKSPLSYKDNCDILPLIEQNLHLIRKLYNENKEDQSSERTTMTKELLGTLKSLSVCPDNHKTILEMGLVNFVEKLATDPDRPVELYQISLDILKNCTFSDNAVPVLLESNICNKLVEEVTSLYDMPDLIASNPDVKSIFISANMNFSNLCKSKKGFDFIQRQLGMDKLIDIGQKTSNSDILTAVSEMISNYVDNEETAIKVDVDTQILPILQKTMNLKKKTPELMTKCYTIAGKIYNEKMGDKLKKLNFVKNINDEYDKLENDPEYVESVVTFLAKLCHNNVRESNALFETGLIDKIRASPIHIKGSENSPYIEKLTAMYPSVLVNNIESIEKFCNIGLVNDILNYLDFYKNPLPGIEEDEANNICLNAVKCLDSIAISDKAINYLVESKFPSVIFDVLETKQDQDELCRAALHSFGNYLYKEVNGNLKTFSFERLLQILISMQKKWYSNSDILININYIIGYLMKLMKSAKDKLYQIVSSSIKTQDWNIPLVTMALKLMNEIITLSPVLVDDVYEETIQSTFSLLKLHKEIAEVHLNSYKLLQHFGKNYIYSYSMVNSGLIDLIRETVETDFPQINLRSVTREAVFNLLSVIANDPNNAKKISDRLMLRLLKDLKEEEFSKDHAIIVSLLNNLLKQRYCVEPFIQYQGMETILKLFRDNPNDIALISDIVSILTSVADTNDEYKRMMSGMKVTEMLNEMITRCGYMDKKLEFDARTLIFSINSASIKLEQVEELKYVDIKVENPIKPEVKNFLTNGKITKIINSKGDVKTMNLQLTSDLMKIIAKKPKSNLPPKPKYIIEVTQIKQLIKGHGTDAFKKSKGLFRSIPKPEKCFSVIGPTTIDGVKSINVNCETEEEVNKWMANLETVINYFKKTRTIKSQVVIKK